MMQSMSDDLIRRSDAIEAIRNIVAQYIPFLNRVTESLPLNCEIAIRSVPSAERPQGEWIRDDIGTLICSECKRPRRDNRIGHTNFCNSCGADMREGETGEQVHKI